MSTFDARKEVTGIILFFSSIALTLIYFLSESIIGPIGVGIKNIGFGFMGVSAYIIPFFLFYAAIDFFLEKREGVSPIRVRSVILFLICFAALLAVATNDFEYIKTLCVDNIGGKVKATKALSLFWTSGPKPELITNPNTDSNVFAGGLIGGSIACALTMMLGKVISILTLIVVLLTQVILVFQVSLKKTAKSAVKYLNNARTNAVKSVKAVSGNSYGRTNYSSYSNIPRQNSYNPAHAPQGNAAPINSPYVNLQGSSKKSSGVLPPRDPFSRDSLPVDRKTGFTDVSAAEFGVQQQPDLNSLNYENRQVSTNGYQTDAPTNYEFDAMPKNAPLRTSNKKYSRPSFLSENNQESFYSLENGVYPNTDNGFIDVNTNINHGFQNVPGNENYNNFSSEDLPQEIVDDDPYDYADTSSEVPVASNVVVEAPAQSQIVPKNEPVNTVHNEVSVANSEIANDDVTQSYDPLQGRTVETNEANHAASTDFGAQEARKPANRVKRLARYTPPPMNLLAPETVQTLNKNDASVKTKGEQLVETLKSFGIDTEVVHTTFGPAITRYELKFKNAGVKVSRVLSLENDIALAMAAISVRIEAPIPGTSLIGIEIPNEKTSAVQLSGLIRTQEFKNAKPLEVPLGKNISGKPIMCDLAKMPHLLIAGSTGSGKSVCINTILASILYHSSPNDVRMILVDPKVVELSIYNGIPHLLMPVVTDPKKAISALKWAALEMDRRYKLFAESNVRNLDGYNDYLKYKGEPTLPLILIVVDELADLMTLAKNEVEEQISRLAAMARAAGLHLILATQRPSVDVISGVIKANVPSRIAFAVSSGTDSRTILDSNGAEKLLGKGDMLYAPNSAPKAVRGQGAFLSDKEVDSIVGDLRKRYGDMYDDAIIQIVESQAVNNGNTGGTGMGVSEASSGAGADDELLDFAVDIVIEAKNASVSILQRRLGIGYPRAARLIDVLEQKHVIGPFEGSKPRKVLITKTDWLEMKAKGN